jgi:hypothetical protein
MMYVCVYINLCMYIYARIHWSLPNPEPISFTNFDKCLCIFYVQYLQVNLVELSVSVGKCISTINSNHFAKGMENVIYLYNGD